MSKRNAQLRGVLLKHAEGAQKKYSAPWLDQKPLTRKNANKFILGAIIDYQIDADMAWKNAKKLAESILGDPEQLLDHIIQSYTRKEWASNWRNYGVHRFPVAHDRIWRIGNEIVQQYGGDARNIWQGKNAEAVLKEFEGIRCGPEISRMVVGCLVTNKLIVGKGDVKADRHVCRVLGSIFNRLLEPLKARQLAAAIYPDNPWEIDIALYDIGKTYCLSDWCYCDECPVGKEDLCEDYSEYKTSNF